MDRFETGEFIGPVLKTAPQKQKATSEHPPWLLLYSMGV
jgi:hypothetical protein